MKPLYFLAFVLAMLTLNISDAKEYVGVETIEKMNLAEKGAQVWQDMEYLPFEDVGFGNYIRKYTLNDGNFLIMNGHSLKEAPRSIYVIDTNHEVIKTIKNTYVGEIE